MDGKCQPQIKNIPWLLCGGTPNITISHTINIGTPPFTNWELIHPGFDYRRQNHWDPGCWISTTQKCHRTCLKGPKKCREKMWDNKKNIDPTHLSHICLVIWINYNGSLHLVARPIWEWCRDARCPYLLSMLTISTSIHLEYSMDIPWYPVIAPVKSYLE